MTVQIQATAASAVSLLPGTAGNAADADGGTTGDAFAQLLSSQGDAADAAVVAPTVPGLPGPHAGGRVLGGTTRNTDRDGAGDPSLLPGDALAGSAEDPLAATTPASDTPPATDSEASVPPALAMLLAQSAFSQPRGTAQIGTQAQPAATFAPVAVTRAAGVAKAGLDASTGADRPGTVKASTDMRAPEAGVAPAADGVAAVRTQTAAALSATRGTAAATDGTPGRLNVDAGAISSDRGVSGIPSMKFGDALTRGQHATGQAPTSAPAAVGAVSAHDLQRDADAKMDVTADRLAQLGRSNVLVSPPPVVSEMQASALGGGLATIREREQLPWESPQTAGSPLVDLQASTRTPTGVADGAAQVTDAAGFAGAVADQISWWLSQKTQGAELTVQGPNGAPVSVSVQVQGNEAHVAFRSEQALARQMLGNALPQLEQLLGNSGLVLGQVSVGSGSGGRDERPAPEGSARIQAVGGAASNASGATPSDIQRQAASTATARGGIDLYV